MSHPDTNPGMLRKSLVRINNDFWFLFVLVLVSVLQLFILGHFQFPGVISGPMHGWETGWEVLNGFKVFGDDETHIGGLTLQNLADIYYIADILWQAMISIFLARLAVEFAPVDVQKPSQKRLRNALILIFWAAYIGLTLYINLSYLNSWGRPMVGKISAVDARSILIGIVGFLLLMGVLTRVLSTNRINNFLKGLFAMGLSLLILFLVGSLLPEVDQVNSLVINLYSNPVDWLYFVIFIPYLAKALAHYPSYFYVDGDNRSWRREEVSVFRRIPVLKYFLAPISEWVFRNPWFPGIITYKNKENQTGLRDNEHIANYFMRMLGAAFFVAFFYMIAYTSQVNYGWHVNIGHMALGFLLILASLLYWLKMKKDRWLELIHKEFLEFLPDFYDGDFNPKYEGQYRFRLFDSSWIRTKGLEMNEAILRDKFREFKKPLNGMNLTMNIYTLLWVLSTAVTAGFLVLIFIEREYNLLTVSVSLVMLILQGLQFVYYRSIRSILKFLFFDPENRSLMEAFTRNEENWPKIKRFFELAEEEGVFRRLILKGLGIKAGRPLHWLGPGGLSNSRVFLEFNAVMGWINMFWLLAIQFNTDLAERTSAAVIIIGTTYLLYATIALLSKNLANYLRIYKEPVGGEAWREEAPRGGRQFPWIFAIFLCLLFGLGILSRTSDNNLFELRPIPRWAGQEVSLHDFVRDLDQRQPDKADIYYGAVGGGLLSNAWTTTVMNTLYQQHPGTVDQAVGFGGASGGTMGMTNFFPALYGSQQRNFSDPASPERTEEEWKAFQFELDEILNEVSTENMLSIDIARSTGLDLANLWLTPRLKGKEEWDRASVVMKRFRRINRDPIYAARHPDSLIPFREYWAEMYNGRQKHLPILMANSTNVRGNHGLGVSVRIDDPEAEAYVYQGATNLLELQDPFGEELTLDFYDAMSTSNRFPLLSSAAKIPNLGHFNDGGIFENSGLYSVFKLYSGVHEIRRKIASNTGEPMPEKPTVFVNIVISTQDYARKILKDKLQAQGCMTARVNNHSELGAILSAIADTEMWPREMRSTLANLGGQLSRNIRYFEIHMPHKLTVKDLKDVFGKEVLCKEMEGKEVDAFLYQLVQENNEYIDNLVKMKYRDRPVVEPPFGRAMSVEGHNFMKAMMSHWLVQQEMQAFLDEL